MVNVWQNGVTPGEDLVPQYGVTPDQERIVFFSAVCDLNSSLCCGNCIT